MKIKIWECSMCDDPVPCIMPVEVGNKHREAMRIGCWNWEHEIGSCPYVEGQAADFKLEEIEDTELIKYFTTLGRHYSLIPICDLRNGICPKECDGQCEGEDGKGCDEKKRIARSLNVN